MRIPEVDRSIEVMKKKLKKTSQRQFDIVWGHDRESHFHLYHFRTNNFDYDKVLFWFSIRGWRVRKRRFVSGTLREVTLGSTSFGVLLLLTAWVIV